MSDEAFGTNERRHACRVLRRHGVRRAARGAFVAEVTSELSAAAADGRAMQDVIGTNSDVELLNWARELGITGRSAQLPVVLGSVLAATGLAMTLALIGALARPVPGQFVIALYIAAAAVCVCGAPAVAAWQLRRRSDRHVSATVRLMLAALPFGGIVAAAAGWLAADRRSYQTDDLTITAVLVVILLVLTAAVTVARLAALRTKPVEPAATQDRSPVMLLGSGG